MRLLTLLTFLVQITTASAQVVALDPTFGTGGIVHHAIEPYYDKINGVTIQPDGKILVTGYSIAVNANWNIVLVRYNEDGSFDSGFGTNGVVVTDIGPSHEEGHAVVVQPDGRIVVAGYMWVVDPNGTQAFAVALRYLADGTLDATFGTAGITVANTGYPADYAYAVALQADGRIVLGGTSDNVAFCALRLLPDGTLDSGFGVGGWAVASLPVLYALGRSIVIQPDGRIVLAGEAMYYNADSTNTFQDFALVRMLANGTMDASFGTQGRVFTDLDGTGGRADGARAVVLQPDGKLVVGGLTVSSGGDLDIGLARYLPNGTLDPSFGTAGAVITDFFTNSQEARGLHLMADGRILVGGHHYHDFAALRYLSDGTLDPTFGTNGLIHSEIDPLSYEYGNAIAVYPDGRVVVAGETTFQCYERKFAIMRYTSDAAAGVDGATVGTAVQVFPNPVRDRVRVNWIGALPMGTAWILVDAVGRTVRAGRLGADGNSSTSMDLDLTALSASVYQLRVGAVSVRLVKE